MRAVSERPSDHERLSRLRAAEEWRARRQPKKAIAELRRLLAVEPRDPVAHARLAPLLVLTGDTKAAVPSLRIAARDLEARGFADKAVSLHLQLVAIDPTDVTAWRTASRLHLDRGRAADAVKVLTEGARHQRGPRAPVRAVELLRAAATLAREDIELLIELARAERKVGRVAEARELLRRAVEKSEGQRQRRRALWATFSVFPGLGALFRWVAG
jgi:tetratricopeptide (TPR) repeat protein